MSFKEYIKDVVLNEELTEATNFKKMTNKQLLAWLEKNDTDDSVSPVFGRQIMNAKKEKKRRGLTEATKSKYNINHKSLSSAVEEALDYAVKNGYQVNDDDVWDNISTGPKKPSDGETNKYTIRLEKNGKEQKKALHFQVYGKGKEGYELNCYIL